ncbi:MAG: GNAT family N-acetyltransferase [Chloroflexota bacterium]|jgi:ribosomal protein S18 acetylase RimI-like enzyme
MLRIEPAGLHDMPGAYRVCLLTGDAGADASALHRDPDLLGHVYVGPYLRRGEGTQLVAVDDGGVAGYLLSTDDTLAFEAWAEHDWWPSLRTRYPRLDDGSPDARLVGLIHEPMRARPRLAGAYPAHLHIDLLARTRGSGLGRALIERLLADLRGRGVGGVHFGVSARNTNAIGFYQHLGFQVLERERWGLTMGLRLP